MSAPHNGTGGKAGGSDPFNAARKAFLERVEACPDIDHPTTVLIAWVLAEYFNRATFSNTGELVAYPSHQRLSNTARISQRAVQTQCVKLRNCGLFEVKKGGGGGANRYIARFGDRKPTSGQEGVPDRKPTSGQTSSDANADRKSSAARPEVERRQTGSQLRTTSDTSETSDDSPTGLSITESALECNVVAVAHGRAISPPADIERNDQGRPANAYQAAKEGWS